MAEGPRSMPYRVEWPLTPSKVEEIDSMLQMLFDDIRNGSISEIIEITEENFVGILPPESGGTGLTSYSIGDIIYADGADSITTLGIGSANQVLQVNAGATAPEWGLVAFENMTPAAAPSTLIGRRSGSTGNWEAITLGTNLTMTSGGVLNASGGGGGGGPADGYWTPLMTGISLTGYPEDSEMVLDADGDAIMVWIPTP